MHSPTIAVIIFVVQATAFTHEAMLRSRRVPIDLSVRAAPISIAVPSIAIATSQVDHSIQRFKVREQLKSDEVDKWRLSIQFSFVSMQV